MATLFIDFSVSASESEIFGAARIGGSLKLLSTHSINIDEKKKGNKGSPHWCLVLSHFETY
jgi:hypothetical protein